jgi:hypothetical protein
MSMQEKWASGSHILKGLYNIIINIDRTKLKILNVTNRNIRYIHKNNILNKQHHVHKPTIYQTFFQLFP